MENQSQLFIDVSSPHITGTWDVIKDAWDEISGWHYVLVKSFETKEEAEEFISDNNIQNL